MKALVIIDMQMEMQRRIDAGQDCVNADAPARIKALAEAFRQKGLPVVHIRHRDNDAQSPFNAAAPGYAPMPCAKAVEGEAIFIKNTSSAFASTYLAAYLHDEDITDLVVTGAVAGFCVNTNVRNASDLGFHVTVVEDAVIGFDLPSAPHSAQVIFDVTMAHLAADFARMTTTAEALAES